MRPIPPRYVEIINVSDKPHELRDPALGPYPDDRVLLRPKDTLRVPVAAFLRLQHLPYLMRKERFEALVVRETEDSESPMNADELA